MCGSSFIVSGHQEFNTPFEVEDQHLEVVLVSGEVRCVNTHEIFIAPCVIPKNIKHILMRPDKSRLLVITHDISTESTDLSSTEEDDHSFQNRLRALVQSFISSIAASIKEKATLSWLEKKANSLDNWWRRKMGRRQAPNNLEEANGPPTAFETPASNAELAANDGLTSYQHTSQLVNRPALARDTEPEAR